MASGMSTAKQQFCLHENQKWGKWQGSDWPEFSQQHWPFEMAQFGQCWTTDSLSDSLTQWLNDWVTNWLTDCMCVCVCVCECECVGVWVCECVCVTAPCTANASVLSFRHKRGRPARRTMHNLILFHCIQLQSSAIDVTLHSNKLSVIVSHLMFELISLLELSVISIMIKFNCFTSNVWINYFIIDKCNCLASYVWSNYFFTCLVTNGVNPSILCEWFLNSNWIIFDDTDHFLYFSLFIYLFTYLFILFCSMCLIVDYHCSGLLLNSLLT